MTDDAAVRVLYQNFLDGWNNRDAAAMAALLDDDGFLVGFDGSLHDGPRSVAAELGAIFAEHQTPRFVGLVQQVICRSDQVAILRAALGLVPPEADNLEPEGNAIQVLTAVKRNGSWRILVLQTTPAAYHGRPEAQAALTEALRRQLRDSSTM